MSNVRGIHFSQVPAAPPVLSHRARPARHAEQFVPCLVCGLVIARGDLVVQWTSNAEAIRRAPRHQRPKRQAVELHVDCGNQLALAKKAAKLRAQA